MRSCGMFTQTLPKIKVQVFALSMRYLVWKELIYISRAWTSHICVYYLGKCKNLDFLTRLAYEQFVSIFKHIWLHRTFMWDFPSNSAQNKSPGFGSKHEIFGLERAYIHISSFNKPYLRLLSRKMQKPGLFDTLGIWAICKHFQAYLAWLCVHMGC